MHRRALLAAASSAAAIFAGCLADDDTPAGESTDADGSSETDDDGTDTDDTDDVTGSDDHSDADRQHPPYDECDRAIIWYSGLPEPVAAEVDEAFADGRYETTENLYYEQAVAVDDTWLQRDDEYYRATVELSDEDETTQVLSFEPDTPMKSSDEELGVVNQTDEVLELSVTVVDAANETLLEESLTEFEPNHEEWFPVTRAYGDYEVTVEYDDGTRHSDDWRIQYTQFDAMALVEAEGLEVQPGSVMDPPPCPWS